MNDEPLQLSQVIYPSVFMSLRFSMLLSYTAKDTVVFARMMGFEVSIL
ncbi:MAG TPA: hypothetical protein PLM71_00070 [Syntrophorhabdaceae bacterium]|nr:hypothetical protein [Syntrophorhabdaceae bacterium]HPU28703.1 hypothetical protein [Syntrophorhabdaceae bacterium]